MVEEAAIGRDRLKMQFICEMSCLVACLDLAKRPKGGSETETALSRAAVTVPSLRLCLVKRCVVAIE